VTATAIQQDGKILVAGDSMFVYHGSIVGHHELNLLRFNTNGSLDSTFGSKGIVTFNFTSASNTEAGAVAVQPNGKIVVSGWVEGDFALVRFNTNGSLDTGFGSGGSARIHFPSGAIKEPHNSGSQVRLVIQPDGKLVASGTVDLTTSQDSFAALARVNGNGTLDGSFGSGGEVTAALGSSASLATGLALQSDGKFVVAGSSWSPRPDLALARFNSNGTPDSTFNGNGLLVVDISAAPYNADSHFFENCLTDVAIQGDGKIVAAGLTEADGPFNGSSYSQFVLLRVNASGSVDSTFGNTGLVVTDATSAGDEANAVLIQSDGKILLGGTALARYLPSDPQVASFTANANPVTSGSSTTLTASNFTDSNPSSTGTQTSPGVWTFTFTVNLAPGTYTLFAQAEDNFGVFGDPLALVLTVQ
jgi:uncharacterized delta-60 repeat protein